MLSLVVESAVPGSDFLVSIGITGFLAIVGCWLVLGAIIGNIPAIKQFFNADITLQHSYQRILVGGFGVVLLAPTLHLMYQGSTSRILTPSTPDYVAPASGSLGHTHLRRPGITPGLVESDFSASPVASGHLVLASAVGGFPQNQAGCKTAESFGLGPQNIRRLKYQSFHGRVYVYVGSISAPQHGATDVTVLSSDDTGIADGKIDDASFQRVWNAASPLRMRKPMQAVGDSFDFTYEGHTYRLKVSQIYKVLIGNDQIVLDICAM